MLPIWIRCGEGRQPGSWNTDVEAVVEAAKHVLESALLEGAEDSKECAKLVVGALGHELLRRGSGRGAARWAVCCGKLTATT